MIHIILLSGGSGSRLWPLSNEARSKQFLKVLRDEAGNGQSMVQRTFEKLSRVDAELDIVIATCATQKAAIEAQIDGGYSIVVEPERRDTAPAIMLSAAFLAFQENADPGDTVVVMPIDTFADQGYYDNIALVDGVVRLGEADLVLLGAEPTYPTGKYGYIVPGPARGAGGAREVERFVEKPTEDLAAQLIGKGALWNCGVFGFRLSYLTGIISRYTKRTDFEQIRASYRELPKNSFDYEVVEKASSIAVVPYSGTWKDLGTWNTLTEEMAEAQSGRVVCDGTCENTHVINETGLPMVVAGMRDAVVVATPDGIIVADKERSANIKPYVSEAAESRPMYESRQWGEYKVLGSERHPSGINSLEKLLIVRPGRQLSYQCHRHRSEIWTVVDGAGEVVLDGEARPVSPGTVIMIAAGQKHSIRAFSELHIIEVQMGTDLIEEDIERLGFFWDNAMDIELNFIGGKND